MTTIHDHLADATRAAVGEGAILRCKVCGKERPANRMADYFMFGWPQCHLETMLLVTVAQLERERLDAQP